MTSLEACNHIAQLKKHSTRYAKFPVLKNSHLSLLCCQSWRSNRCYCYCCYIPLAVGLQCRYRKPGREPCNSQETRSFDLRGLKSQESNVRTWHGVRSSGFKIWNRKIPGGLFLPYRTYFFLRTVRTYRYTVRSMVVALNHGLIIMR